MLKSANIVEDWIKEGYEKGLYEGMEKGIEKGMEKGIEKGMEKGIEKGIEEGMIRAKWSAIIDVLKLRFGKIPADLPNEIKSISKIKQLDNLHKKAVLTKSISEFAIFVKSKNKKGKM